ncbi:hypothetical protein F5J12DRAFT_779149 [Pisolithus orientalis]|uniref:uncharacterized protein n=1 Tax=Pisolithus orientalis TaxID=936130 RepID=UPI00222475C0|nr:uncharacterized protein F5J12DRAFT_779149 [Pisolithus orientalis]KAI6032700.1 hypothetical protein F5J12DRAFT_779149 [Pisolithus orientalis]
MQKWSMNCLIPWHCCQWPVLAVGKTAQGTPEMGQVRGKKASQSPDHEKWIQAAILGVANGLYKSYSEAAKAEGRKCLLIGADRTLVVPPPSISKIFVLEHFRGLNPKRAQNFNKMAVKEYFKLQHELEEKYDGIPPEHHWNMDEKGCQMGGGRQGSGMKFIFSLEDKEHYHLHSDNLELVSIIECVNAADQELCETWFQETFIPNALACQVDDKPIVLSVDGHDSHETDKLKQLHMNMASLSLHSLQKRHTNFNPWMLEFSHLSSRNGLLIVGKYMKVHKKAMMPELIKKSFSHTGIYPFNPDIFTDRDFAPSRATSCNAHLPPSYPPEVPIPQASSSMTPMDNESDEDGNDKEFSYDPALDGTHKAFQDHGFPCFSSLTTFSSQNGTHVPMEPTLLSGNRTITSSENSSESTGGKITIPEDHMHALPAMQVDECKPMPVYGCTPFTGPVLPLVLLAQYSETSKEDGWEYICQLHAENQALVTTVATQAAQLESSNTHCTMVRYKISALWEQQASKKKGKAWMMKFSA